MAHFLKGSVHSFFGKNWGDKLLGGVKGISNVLDEPLVQAAVMGLAPEIGLGLAGAKRAGILEKLKHIDDY